MRLIYIALGWTLGIVWAVNSGSRTPLGWGLLAVFSLVVLWLWWPTRWRNVALGISALLLGGARAGYIPISSDIANYNALGGLTIHGQVIGAPDRRDTATLLQVQAHSITRIGQTIPTSGIVLVYAPPSATIHYGDTLNATGVLEIPGVYDSFSYADYLARAGIFSIMRNAAVEVTATDGGNPAYAWLLQQKDRAATRINRALPEPQAGLLVGILLGDARGLSPQLQADFAATGAAHIVAISGFNMVILAATVLRVLEAARVPRRVAGAVALVVIGVYTLLVGAGASVVRAALMSAVLIVGQSLGRKGFIMATLAFTALVMSAVNPLVLWDVGFQLSFFATFGLVTFADPLTRALDRALNLGLPREWVTRLKPLIAEPIVVSIAALIPTLPLTALYFQRVSLVQLAVNLLVVPIQSAVLLLGVAATLLGEWLFPLAQLLYWGDLVLLGWTVAVVRRFASLPFADVEFFAASSAVWGALAIMVTGSVLRAARPRWAERGAQWVQSRAVFVMVISAGVLLTALCLILWRARPDGNLHIHVLDVGHSNGVLIVTPRGAQLLVDGGRYPSRLLTHLGERMPFHDRTLEAVILTQPDENLYGALPAVLRRYDAGVVIHNGQPNLAPAYDELLTLAAAFPQVEARAGTTITLSDGVTLDVLAPAQRPALDVAPDDGALVLRVSYGDVSFLLTGELSATGQAALLASEQWPLADVFQLPLHGRARQLDGEFLAAAQPQAVVIQSDRANRLGDPDGDVLTQLGDLPLFRSDTQGSLHLWTDGITLWDDG